MVLVKYWKNLHLYDLYGRFLNADGLEKSQQ